MNKEEILAKSRQENKNRDIAEIDKAKSASKFALIVSAGFTCLWTFISVIATSRVNFSVIATEFCMIFTFHLYKAVKHKSFESIVCAAVLGTSFLLSAFMAVRELFDFKS